jgi:VWFA-related protein
MKPQTPRRRRPLPLLLLGLSLVVCCGIMRAPASGAHAPHARQTIQSQTPAQPPAQAPAQTAAPHASPPVKLDVIVTDESNNFVANLRQEDFRVEEDGVPQSLTFFAQESSSPLSYSLLVDNTGSLRTMFDRVLETGATVIAGKGEQDEMSVVRFVTRDRIELMQDFTRDRGALVAALDSMYIEPGATALTEALYVAAEAVVARAPGEGRRRALVVVTDGGERDPRANLDELLKYLRRHDVAVFVFGLTDAMSGDAFDRVKGGRRAARELLDTLARESGGHAVFPKKPAEFDAAARALNARLRMPRYTLGYAPPVNASNKPRKIEVKLAGSARNDEKKARLRANFRVRGAAADATAPRGK